MTVRAAATHNTGTARTGDREAAAAELPSARQTARQVARRPLCRIGSSIHFQEAAARVIAVAVSAAQSQGARGRGPVIAAAIAMTGQCQR